jgi:hypothetical protein
LNGFKAGILILKLIPYFKCIGLILQEVVIIKPIIKIKLKFHMRVVKWCKGDKTTEEGDLFICEEDGRGEVMLGSSRGGGCSNLEGNFVDIAENELLASLD